MQRTGPSLLVTRALAALPFQSTSAIGPWLVVPVVAVALVVTVALLLVGFVGLLWLLAWALEHSLHVTPGRPTVSRLSVLIVIVGFLGASAAAVALARRRTRAEPGDADEEVQEEDMNEGAHVTIRNRIARLREDPARSIPTVLEIAIYVGVALLLLWPVTLHLASRYAGWNDAKYYTWLNWRVGQMIRSGHVGLRIPDVVWPYGIDVRLIDGQLPTLIGGLWNVVAGPFLAQNLGLMTGTLLNLWAGRRIGKLFSDRREVWVLTAIAFATAPSIVARLEVHFTLYYAFPAALLVEEAVRVARGDHPIRPIRLGLLLFVAFVCGVYILVFGAIAFALIVLFSITPLSAFPRAALRGAAGIGLALLLVSPFLWARLQNVSADRPLGASPVLLPRTFIAEGDAVSIVAQPSTSTIDLPGAERLRRSFRKNVHESTVFPGFLLLLGLGGLLLLRSPLRWPLLIATLGIWLFSMGSSLKIDGSFAYTARGSPVAWLPYTGLINLVGLGSLRSPNRASFTLAAVLAVPFAISGAWLFERFSGRWQRTALGAGAAAILATNLLIPIHQGTMPGNATIHAALEEIAARAQPGETVELVPADCEHGTVILQILHRSPIVSCGSSTAAITWSHLHLYLESGALAALRCDPGHLGPLKTPFRRSMRFDAQDVTSLQGEFGVRFYLINMPRLRSVACTSVRESALPILEGYEHLGQDRRMVVIDVGSPAGGGG